MSAAKVLLVDYGVGNLLSVSRALQACGGAVEQTGDPQRILAAERLVLPGVGAFGGCMEALGRHGLVEPLRAYARSGRPLLGICVGMQLLFDEGEEFGRHVGLGLLQGAVGAIAPVDDAGHRRKIPHVGWSALQPPDGRVAWSGGLLADTRPGQSVYFVHSFAAHPSRPEDLLAVTDYAGCRIASVVGHGAVLGCQFHPEKSGPVGLTMLRRFLSL
ncbi:MAG: imidazole glycerol phosphate synthase subunit HisH [Alphaproteobacteria bacterium]|nr:imidazole glycerol phosphate synthase subunit HisH [Alphaproteobacteria bacterium]